MATNDMQVNLEDRLSGRRTHTKHQRVELSCHRPPEIHGITVLVSAAILLQQTVEQLQERVNRRAFDSKRKAGYQWRLLIADRVRAKHAAHLPRGELACNPGEALP